MRKSIPKAAETNVLTQCKRRCAVCYGLHLDVSIKKGQIAHLDQEAANNELENLVFLCFDHHDEYDSRTSQSKGLTKGEVRHFRDELIADIYKIWKKANPFNISSLIDIKQVSGHYLWEAANSTAELDVRATDHNKVEISGLAFWGVNNQYGPNIGQIDFKESLIGNDIHYLDTSTGYEMHISFTQNGLTVHEVNNTNQFGMNVGFAGKFRQVDPTNPAPIKFDKKTSVSVRDGNIFVTKENIESQLTFWGLDKNPFTLNNDKVLFIRQEEAIAPSHDDRSSVRTYYTHQVIVVDIKTTFERIVTSRKPYEDGLDGTDQILSIRTPTLSADQKFIYFVTEKWATASLLAKVNIETGIWIELFSAESFEVISEEGDNCLFLIAKSEIRNQGRDVYYKLCNESGMVLKEFDSQQSMLKYKNSRSLNI